MKSVEFTLTAISPVFIGGATQNAEIRSQTIKGMLRFWWRALKAEDDIKKLHEEEAKLFGGQIEEKNHKNGKEEKVTYQSKVKVVIENIKGTVTDEGEKLNKTYDFQWKYDRNSRTLNGKDRGIGYLLYSVVSRRNYKPGTSFTVKFYSSSDEVLKNTVAAFWCAVYLGGFGARSRRGGGNFYVSKVSGDTYGIDFTVERKDCSLENWIKGNLEKCQEIVGSNKTNKYSNLSSCSIIISKECDNNKGRKSKDLLNELGVEYLTYREKHRSEVESAAFGLPIVHSNGGTVNLMRGNEKLRRASPLIFKVMKFNNSFYWLALRFSGEFKSQDMKVNFNSRDHLIDDRLVNEFWDTLNSINDKDKKDISNNKSGGKS
ncbi:MAG: RAMP superfamily protein [Spirochaetes bacterium ADurb.Bin218]|nr:MAG: RAMP superfamily protein [Spirochaetes bacterium ADurb.Bin218]